MNPDRHLSVLPGLVILLFLPFFARATAQESPWPMFRHDLKHSGHTPYTGPATPTLAWTFPAADGIVSSAAIDPDGTIYVGAGGYFGAIDHNLYALHPDGSLKWSYEADAGFFSSPALAANNTIYISALDGYLYAIEDLGTTGRRKWRTFLDPPYFALSSPAVGADGTVYVGSPSLKFYAIHPDDGSIEWSWRTDWCIISSPAIGDDGIIYIGSKDHHLYAFSDTLEAPIWRFPTGEFYDGHLVDSSPAIGADGTIYFGTDPYGAAGHDPVEVDTSFWAVNPDGTLKWSFDTGDGVESSPAIGPDGTIYFGSYDNHLYAVTDAGHEGVLKWKFLTNGPIDGSPAVDGDGVVYIGSRDSTLYALYPDGTVKWTFQAQDGFESSPTIDDKGYLYIGSFDGNFYALGTGAPDVGVTAVHVPSQVTVNATYVPRATVRNYRGADQQFDVACVIRVNDIIVYNDTIAVDIPGGGTSQQRFADWQVGPDSGVTYTVTVTTVLAADDNADNNERSAQTLSVDRLQVSPSGNGMWTTPSRIKPRR